MYLKFYIDDVEFSFECTDEPRDLGGGVTDRRDPVPGDIVGGSIQFDGAGENDDPLWLQPHQASILYDKLLRRRWMRKTGQEYELAREELENIMIAYGRDGDNGR
jgi:hypothetical protein